MYLESLLISQTLSREFFDSIPLVVIGFDQRLNVIVFNKYAERILGYAKEEILNRNWATIAIPKAIRKEIEQLHQKNIREKSIDQEYENLVLNQKGEERRFRWNNTLLEQNGKFQMLLSFGRDITKEHLAQESMELSEKEYKELFNIVNDAIFIHDAKTGKILNVNKKAEAMFGFTREEFIGATPNIVTHKSLHHNNWNAKVLITKAAAGKPQRFKWNSTTKDGKDLAIEVYLQKSVTDQEDVVYSIVRKIEGSESTEQE